MEWAFDTDGVMYVTLPGQAKDGGLSLTNQIIRVDTNGEWTLMIDDPESQKLVAPTNCAFGGPGLKDLYFANLEGENFWPDSYPGDWASAVSSALEKTPLSVEPKFPACRDKSRIRPLLPLLLPLPEGEGWGEGVLRFQH